MGFFTQLIDCDKQLFLLLNRCHSEYFDYLMGMFTTIGIWVPFYMVLIFIIARRYKQKAAVIIPLLILAIVLTDQFSNIVKDLVQRPRPTHEPSLNGMVHYVLTRGADFGFFSAHAANTFALAFFSSKIFRRWPYTVMIFCWAALLCYTRIYVGVHYPFDILCGAICGIGVGWLMYLLCMFLDRRFMATHHPMIHAVKLRNKDIAILFGTLLIIMIVTAFIVKSLLRYHLVIAQNAF